MKINKVILYNFNSFEGVNEFDFSVDDEQKNIVLIGGKNGAGKTSLFTAMKIALYGPLAYGYVGINPHYVAKIKDCINSKAFQTNKVEARVQINISLMVEREMRDYEITREWDYSGQKLVETYYVKLDEKTLDKQELSYFQNYLKSLIPPDLFEFFLFDGEEVGSVFSTSSYNSYVRNAVYTLCGLDTYEIIRKYTHGYAGKATTEDESRLIKEYEETKGAVESAEHRSEALTAEIESIEEKIGLLETERIELETAFKNAGGITDSDRKKLKQDFDKAERVKAESTAKIKMFVEGLMPFYIIKEITGSISEQLDYEEKGEIFHYVQRLLYQDEIQRALSDKVQSVDDVLNMLLDKFKPEGFQEDASPIHDLSKDETARVNAMISMIEHFDAQDMVRTVREKQAAAERTVEINKTLKSAMADEDAAQFQKQENDLLKRSSALNEQLYEAKTELTGINEKIAVLRQQRDHAWQKVKDNAQNKHVFELSTGLSSMMDTLLSKKTEEVKRGLERLIVKNLHRIYRKNNLITHIEIDDAFQFNLYQDASYTAGELAYLMKNLGKTGFATMIGNDGQKSLFEYYSVDSLGKLQKQLSFNASDRFELYKNIDLSRLSRGERQIFILSLYWSIIELSGQDIPFVIDTPYARIDANHRKEISEKFFPNISKQVVILSTDEEINEEYYQIIKPYVAREYLLINDENQNKSSVETRYFFEA